MHRARVREGMKTRKEDALTRASAAKEREEYTRQLTRKWKAGDVYAPHDLSRQEMTKWKQPRQPTKDILDMVGLSPLDEYKVRGLFGFGGNSLAELYGRSMLRLLLLCGL